MKTQLVVIFVFTSVLFDSGPSWGFFSPHAGWQHVRMFTCQQLQKFKDAVYAQGSSITCYQMSTWLLLLYQTVPQKCLQIHIAVNFYNWNTYTVLSPLKCLINPPPLPIILCMMNIWQMTEHFLKSIEFLKNVQNIIKILSTFCTQRVNMKRMQVLILFTFLI